MTWSAPEFAEIGALLARASGLEFPASRITFAETGIRRAMALARELRPGAFLQRLDREPELLQSVFAEITVGETYFFRDPAQLELIRTQVFPDLFARGDGAAPVRIWSAGCSTGEEPYTLAILLEAAGAPPDVWILGTDLCAAAVEAGRRASYPARSFRDAAHPWRERCFAPAGNRWTIDARFRRQITFAVHNLTEPAPALGPGEPTFDLIVCRNVLIYLSESAIARAAQTLIDRLSPGGWLVTSPTDPLLPPTTGLVSLATKAGIAYRREPAARLLVSANVPDFEPAPRIAPPQPRRRPTQPRPFRAPAHPATPSAPPPDLAAAERYVADALRLLDTGQPREALIAARRARYLDRLSVVAHLVLGRAFRLCDRPEAARRSLRRTRTLLAAQAPEEPVRGTDGVLAGVLAAIVTAELSQLAVGARRS